MNDITDILPKKPFLIHLKWMKLDILLIMLF